MSDDGGLLGRHVQPLRDQREAAWQEMVAGIQDDVPAYTRFVTPDEEAGWAEGVMLLFDLFLELAVQDRWLTPLEAQAVRGTGGTRFDQGFEDDEVRASVRIAIGVARTRIMKEYAPTSPEDKEAMDRVLALLDRYGNEVEDLLVEGWEVRRDELAIGSREVVRFVEDLAADRLSDAEFSRRMDQLGMDPDVDQGFVLLPDTAAGAEASNRLKQRVEPTVVLHRSSVVTPHRLLVIPVPGPKEWSAVVGETDAAAAHSHTTALVFGPCNGAAECQDRYAAAVVLVPHLASLADGRAALDAVELTLYSVVASLSPTARRWLRRDVLRGVETHPKLLEFLRVSIAVQFVLNAVERETGWDIKTVRDRRAQLEAITGRQYADAADQTAFVLAYCAARLDA